MIVDMVAINHIRRLNGEKMFHQFILLELLRGDGKVIVG